jgi:hypothetical protein
MRWSTLCPLPAGSAVLRDARCWHGGCAGTFPCIMCLSLACIIVFIGSAFSGIFPVRRSPNLSDTARAFPNVEYYAPWYHEPMPVSLPYEDWEHLSPHGRAITRYASTS